MYVPNAMHIGKLTTALIVMSLQACGGKSTAPTGASSTIPAPAPGAVAEPAATVTDSPGAVPVPMPVAVQHLDDTAPGQPVAASAKQVLELSGEAKGPIDLSKEHRGCSGAASIVPNHVVEVGPGLIRFDIKNKANDPAPHLYVKLPDGRVECGTHDVNGLITLQTSTTKGALRVWVGATSFDAATPYQLRITSKAAPAKPTAGIADADPVANNTDLVVGTPVRLKCGAFRTDKVMYWTPKGGPRLEIGAAERGPYISVATRTDGGQWNEVVDVPEGLASDACVQVVLKADSRVLVSANRAASSSGDPGQLMLWLLGYNKTKNVAVASTWQGTAGDALPAWAK